VVIDTLLIATLLAQVMIVVVVDTETVTTIVTWAAPLVMLLPLPMSQLHVAKAERHTEVDFTTMTDTPVDKVDR